MAVTLGSLAAAGPAAAYVVAGRGGRAAAWRTMGDPGVRRVHSPRHATVLLVVGAVPADHLPALARLHDQLPHPRGVVWQTGADLGPPVRDALPGVVTTESEAAGTVIELHRALMTGDAQTSAALGPDENPTEWEGVGPHGQGGEGMMGGTPYGRPMAMTGPDLRDGLQLDRVPLTLGPYHGSLPAGLQLHVELQGDLIVSCEPGTVAGSWAGAPVGGEPPADGRLLWLADLLWVHGLEALAVRTGRAARTRGPSRTGRPDRDRLIAAARRRLRPALRGVGTIDGTDALERFDARVAGPAAARRPHPSGAALLAEHLPGREWGEAVTTVWSLDVAPLDVPEAVGS